jgi:acetyl esterase/lipase
MKTILLVIAGLALALFAFTRLTPPPNQLDWLNAAWPGDSGVARVAEGVVFDEKTGLKLDVWAPKGTKAGDGKPVLVFYYGGGWAHGQRGHYGFAAKAFAAKGFVVVMPDYRKVPDVRFPAFVEDGANALRWVQDNIAKHGGDPKRVGLSGHSAGAHIAMLLTLDGSWLNKAGVAPGFVRATVGLSGPYDFLPFDSRRSIAAMNQWPRPVETQPIAYASKDSPPVMVVTGASDDTVKPRNAILLAQKLKQLGATVEFRAYNDLGHEDIAMALSKPFRGRAPVLDEASAFLMTHLKVETANADQRR